MVLVFALAAAMCMQAFALADRISRHNEERSHAVMMAQNAAEVYQSLRGDAGLAARLYGGDGTSESWTICYDEEWRPVGASSPGTAYTLVATRSESSRTLLGVGSVTVRDSGGELLCSLPAAWQEGGEDGA